MKISTVSVIVPCYNEESTIRRLLDAVQAQTYPMESMEVVIADGMSTDGTRTEIAQYSREHPELRVLIVDNPERIIPAALNRALQRANGEVIIRLDGHAVPRPDFVEGCVRGLENGPAEVIGSVLDILPGGPGWIAGSIAAAVAHPLGVGDALYRHARRPAFVDTFAFGGFKRALLDKVGYYDESLGSNEDYEFNARIRSSGARIWLDPAIRSSYYSRATLGQLARQYRRYGYWKWRMLRHHPRTLRWRQALPPLFLLALIALAVGSIFGPGARIALAICVLVYLLVLLGGGTAKAIKEKKAYLALGMPLAIAVMHLSWASAFLWSMIGGGNSRT